MKIVQIIIFSLLIMIDFSNLGDNFAGIQNRNGVLFILVTQACFNSIFGSMASFVKEKPLFKRETYNRSYSIVPYFFGKTLCDIPFDILYAVLQITIVYFVVGLNENYIYKYFLLCLVQIISY
jgi:hypothetical protein